MITSAVIQWRPLLALTCIMAMTGVVQEVGAFDRLARRSEVRARRTSSAQAFGLVSRVSVIAPSLLNNDSAILLLTPLVRAEAFTSSGWWAAFLRSALLSSTTIRCRSST